MVVKINKIEQQRLHHHLKNVRNISKPLITGKNAKSSTYVKNWLDVMNNGKLWCVRCKGNEKCLQIQNKRMYCCICHHQMGLSELMGYHPCLECEEHED